MLKNVFQITIIEDFHESITDNFLNSLVLVFYKSKYTKNKDQLTIHLS